MNKGDPCRRPPPSARTDRLSRAIAIAGAVSAASVTELIEAKTTLQAVRREDTGASCIGASACAASWPSWPRGASNVTAHNVTP